MEQKWPSRLWLIRHGQSAGNVARDSAEAANLPTIDIAARDVDVPLSDLGHAQSRALGLWVATADSRPSVVLCSPYVRARQTAGAMLEAAGLDADRDELTIRYDERLREKEFGILDRLTRHGIKAKHPELDEQRGQVGKFYFRPPGGESWCDVILRLRSVIDTMTRDYVGEHVAIVGHQVIVNCFRYLLERLDEAQILAIDREADVPNCAVTSYRFDRTVGKRGKLLLERANFVAPASPITVEPDHTGAAKA